ncbi:MAG: shikimate dehydrogenase [Bacteroidota bacterium]
MRKFGLIGYPLGHSFSARYFAEKFTREGISDCEYRNYPIECLDEFTELVRSNKDLCGLNVTIPYKTEIIRYIDEKEHAVNDIGSVNVLKIRRAGGKTIISGFNSDVTGIKSSLGHYLEKGISKAIILGTGGSSKAVSYVLKQAGLGMTFVSRKKKHGCLAYSDLTPESLRESDLIVNTTPLGMFPDTGSMPAIDYNSLSEKHILFDLVYNPEITAFLRKGKERGCRIVTGLGMLYAQAERSWEIWNDDNL